MFIVIKYHDIHPEICPLFIKNQYFSNWNRFLTIIKSDLLQDVSNQNIDLYMVTTECSYFVGLISPNIVILGFENLVSKSKLQWSFKLAENWVVWKITAIFFHFSNIIFIRLSLYKSQTKHVNSLIVVGRCLNRPWLWDYRLLWLSYNRPKNRFLSPRMVTFPMSKPSISKNVASFYLYLSYEFSIVTFDHISRSYGYRSVFWQGVDRSLQLHGVFGKFPKFNFSNFVFFSIPTICKPYIGLL